MADKTTQRVTVTSIDIPFWDLVRFLVKLSLAAVPASLILALVWALIGSLFGGCLVMGSHMGPGL